MSFQVELSNRAVKDLDRLTQEVQKRILGKLERLARDPSDGRLSMPLVNRQGLRKSRVGDWRIIFSLDEEHQLLRVVTIERRGQVYQRI